MAIRVSEDGSLFTLQTKDGSYQMCVDACGVLLHLYYGKRIGEDNLHDLIYRTEIGFCGIPSEAGEDRTYSLDYLPQEVPSSGVGDYREDMIRIRHSDGSCAADFRFEGYKVMDGSYQVPGMPALYDTEEETGQTLVIAMKERASDIRLRLYYGIFEEQNIITRAARLENQGQGAIILEKMLSCNLDFMFGNYEMVYLTGRHAMERFVERTPVGRARVEIGSIRGTSSHQYNPAVVLCEQGAGEESGSCFGACLVYSGNFTASAQKDQRGLTRMQMGINPVQFRFVLESGECFDAPQVILSYSDQGFGKLSNQYHRILREHMCRGEYKYKRRPVLINSWKAAYFDINAQKILQLASEAAEQGIEMLVLDDGWFGKRDDDNSGLGDWFTNEEKMGGTLAQLSDQIHRLGLQFGLWFEPEMISEDSNLYRAHPDWAFRIPGREPNRGRNQLVLDMSREDVRDYLLERLTDILTHAQIEYVKWDMNRSICDVFGHILPAARNGELYHRYVLGVYVLLERFLERFPKILLEGCSGGGGRFDAAMLYYSPQIWCSDNTDAVNRLSIQYGTSFFYPVSTVGSHVSACPNHQTGRSVPFQTRGAVAMAGNFGYELDLYQISDDEKQMVREQIALMKKYYRLIHEGTYYRLAAPKEEEYMAWEFVDQEQSHALLTVVMTDAQGNPVPVHTKVRGLSPEKYYRCSMNGQVHSGMTWNHAGLTLNRILEEYESIMIEFSETAQ